MSLSMRPYPDTVQKFQKCVKFSQSGIVIFDMPIDKVIGVELPGICKENLDKKYLKNGLCKSTVQKLRAKCEFLYNLSKKDSDKGLKSFLKNKGQLVFITLTLPASQMHSDVEVKEKCLEKFFKSINRMFDSFSYVWKAELQRNGNIHFHIVTDRYIDKLKVQNLWNNAVNVLGYLDRFEQKHGHRLAPSTKVEAVKNPEKVGRYLSKYISKDISVVDYEINDLNSSRLNDCLNEVVDKGYLNREFELFPLLKGKKTGCSNDLKQVVNTYDVVDGLLENSINIYEKENKSKVFEGDDFKVIQIDWHCLNLEKYGLIAERYHKKFLEEHERYYLTSDEVLTAPPPQKKRQPSQLTNSHFEHSNSHQKQAPHGRQNAIAFGWLGLPRVANV